MKNTLIYHCIRKHNNGIPSRPLTIRDIGEMTAGLITEIRMHYDEKTDVGKINMCYAKLNSSVEVSL